MYPTIQKIEQLKLKLKKNECIAIVYTTNDDEYDDDDGAAETETRTLIYKDHNDETIFALDDNQFTVEIDETDFSDIDHIFKTKKNFKAKVQTMGFDKSPTNAKRHIGIELEFISKLNNVEVVMAMVDAGVEKFVTVKDDGSLDESDGFEFTHEITILATEREFPLVVRRICKALRGNSTVNKSCGMHVHLDMRTRNPDVAYKALFEAQPVLFAMCPKSRVEGGFSKPITDYVTFIEDAYTQGSRENRYFGINKASYVKHQTIEIRMHSGTLLAEKIINWVNLLLRIVDKTEPSNLFGGGYLQKDLSVFKKNLKLRGKLSEYIDKRIKEFQEDHLNSDFEIAI